MPNTNTNTPNVPKSKISKGRKLLVGGLLTITGITGLGTAANAMPAPTAVRTAAVQTGAIHAGDWGWYGYRLNRDETNQIANLSLWGAASKVESTRLIPYSSWFMRAFSIGWVLTARNARSMGQCLAISYVGTGLIVGCP